MNEPSGKIRVVDRRRQPRHGVVFARDFDSPRFRLLTPIQRLIYVTLTLFADGSTARCWPSRDTIAGITGCGVSTVDHGLNRLEELGYLVVSKRTVGGRRGNEYALMSPPRYPPPPPLPDGSAA